MNKKILLFSRDPGGANTIIPLVEPLKEKGYETRLFGKDVALEKYLKAGLSSLNIIDFVKIINLKSIEDFLMHEKPDFIITGTSADDFTEKYIWKAAEKLNIPSFAILDQWTNYGIRFSKYKISEIREYSNDKKHLFLPSKILVMDDYAKKEAIKNGLESLRILVTGQPYFETILKEKKKISQETILKIKEKLGINESDFIITFASEPLSKDYNNAENYWGYSELTIFKEILESLKIISFKYNKNVCIIIKLHPREDIDNYKDMIPSFKEEKINIIIDKNSYSWDLILASDLICGMSSMFLIESVVLGKPTISVQIGLNRVNPFILDRRGILKSILDKETLQFQLKSVIFKNKLAQCNFNVIENPVKNIIHQMEKYLCQS